MHIYNGYEVARMNIQQIDRQRFLADLRAIEQQYPLKFVGVLPRGTVGHVSGDDAVELLAEKREGLSLLELAGAEIDLSKLLGRPVAIVLVSGLRGDRGERIKASVRPL
jgi:hypothetical protein